MSDNEGPEFDEEYVPEGGIRIGDIYIPPPPAPACTMDATGPRLVITHIENEFFKSYAGKQVLGPFHKSFTSIVGPNGSGKSNVIDSMLFVFGYRAQKIRSKKLSVLIHNSDTHPNVNSCRVAVHFQEILDKEGDDFEEMPNTKIVVARTAFKDNSSFYEINGKRAQFKDVAKLLRAKGIDLDHNRFLILQGEVESISLMKPKALTEHDTGMLEFLEDIIGTSRFKMPIQMLANKVTELSELRTEKLNRVKLVEKEKDELEGPMREAVGWLSLSNEKTKLENKSLQGRIKNLQLNIGKQEEQKNEIESSASELTNKLKELSARRKEIETEVTSKGKEFSTTGKEVERLTAEFNKLEVEDTNLKEDLKNTHNRRKKLIQLLKLEKEKLERLESLPQENKGKIDELEEQRVKLEAKVCDEEANYETAMATLKQETQVYQDEREKHESKLVGLRNGVDGAQSELTIAQNEYSVYTSAAEKEKIRLDQLKNSIDSTKQQISDKGSRLAELKKTIPGKENELTAAQKDAQNAAAEYEEIKLQLQQARGEYEEKSSAQAASKSHGRVHDALMQQKRNGNIPGIIGRLGDLGAIEKKYDVAISTAGKGFLNTIIVDSSHTAKACIEFLKKNDVGRGKFLALEKTTHFQANCDQRLTAPQGVPRLFDLIKVSNAEIRTAFYHYLRDTLVANNMQQATEIAYGATRYRVVTLEGQIIEISGTMSGGGTQKLSGLMGQQVAQQEIDPKLINKLQKSIDQLDYQYRELYNTKQRLEDDITRLTKEIRELQKEERKLSVEVNPLQDQIKMLTNQVAEQEKRVADSTPDKKKVAELDKLVKAAEATYDAATDKASEIEVKVKNCDAKIKEITGTKIKSVQKKRDEAATRLDKIKKEITRLEVETRNSERDMKKSTDKITSLEEEKTEFEDSMKKIVARREEIEVICSKVMTDKTEKIEEQEGIAGNIKELKKKQDEVSKEETELKSSRIEVDQKIEKIDNDIRQLTNLVHCYKRDLKKLKLVDVPDQEMEELTTYADDQLEDLDLEELKAKIQEAIAKLNQSRPNMAAINEFKKKEETYMARAAELEEMTKLRDEQRKHHDDLRKQRLTDFMEGFGIITGKLKEMYQMITLGGDAELELVDSLDPFTEGIVFSVRPPKKSWKNITNLSGGEKTLSSLALVFALHYYKPTPLYVMDEIDAALDFKNVSIVANYIKERTKNAQFIIISLRSNMFELADRLVGIYKTYNCTKSITIDPEKIADKEKGQEKTDVSGVTSGSQIPSSQPLREMEVN